MLNDVLHRLAQASGRIHGDQNKRRMPVRSVGNAFIDVRGEHRFDFAIEIEPQHDWIVRMFIGGGRWQHQKRCSDTNGGEKRQSRSTENSRATNSLHQTMSAHCAPPDGFTFCKCCSNSFASEYLGASFSARSTSVRARSSFFCSR